MSGCKCGVCCYNAHCELPRLRAENAKLRAALQECLEDLVYWAAYAGDYFQKKHGLADDIAKYNAILEKNNAKD